MLLPVDGMPLAVLRRIPSSFNGDLVVIVVGSREPAGTGAAVSGAAAARTCKRKYPVIRIVHRPPSIT